MYKTRENNLVGDYNTNESGADPPFFFIVSITLIAIKDIF